MKKTIIVTVILALLPTILGLITLLYFNGSGVKEYLVTFFNEKLSTDNSTFVIIGYLFLLLSAQMMSAYAYNRINHETPSYTKLKKSLTYVFNRIMLLTYAIYEFFAVYVLVILVFGFFLTNVDLQENRISSNFLEMILLTILVVLIIGLFFKIIVDALYKKYCSHKYIGKIKIDQESNAGKMILDLQSQFCNIAYLLILPLTLLSVFSQGVGESERALFLALTSLVIACYIFLIMKSRIYNFFMKPID